MAAIRQSDLEQAFSPRLVAQAFCDDGSSEAGPRLKRACQIASDEAHAVLGKVKAWQTQEAFQTLVDEDAGVKYAVCKIAMAVGIEAKPEWYSSEGPHRDYRSSARTYLKDLAEAKLRSPAEDVAGENTTSVPRVVNARQPEFARRRGRPSRGSF